jgi:TP901 family phage tail tape measure protein
MAMMVSYTYKAIDKFTAPLAKMAREVDRLNSRIAAATNRTASAFLAVDKAAGRARSSVGSLNHATRQLQGMALNAERYAAAMRKASAVRVPAEPRGSALAQGGGKLPDWMDKVALGGAGWGAYRLAAQSANLDKALTLLRHTAGATKEEAAQLRKELFRMSGETGRNVDELQGGFSGLVASGLDLASAKESTDAINKGLAVSTAKAGDLAGALTVAGAAYGFDFPKAGQAQIILDKMYRSGQLGSAELEHLGALYARVGVNAKVAGFRFEQGLAFIQGLSRIEKNPEKLGTLVDSTLRVFTNLAYLKDAQKATGVKFFDAKGARRDPLVVIGEMRKKFKLLKTDAQRALFVDKAFGDADADTKKGLTALLSDPSHLNAISDFVKDIESANGAIARELPDAIDNAASQAGRLKTRMREAADAFAQPINNAFTKLTAKLLDKKADGGLELSNTQLAVGAALAAMGAYGAVKATGKLGSKLAGGGVGLATGVVMGSALEQAGVTSVFVVGAAPGVFGGAGLGKDVLPGKGGGRANRAMSGAASALASPAGAIGLGAFSGAAIAASTYERGGLLQQWASSPVTQAMPHGMAINAGLDTDVGRKIGELTLKLGAWLGNEEASNELAMRAWMSGGNEAAQRLEAAEAARSALHGPPGYLANGAAAVAPMKLDVTVHAEPGTSATVNKASLPTGSNVRSGK